MPRTGWAGLVAVAMAAGGLQPAFAAEPRPASADPTVSELIVTATKEVSELTVVAKVKCLEPERSNERATRPKVVSSYPPKGAVVRPGLLVVRVTFDQPMTCDGFFLRDAPRLNPCPDGTQHLLLSYDRKTVRTACVIQPNTDYGLSLSEDPNGKSFVGLGGLPSLPYRLDFSTGAGPLVTTVCDALIEDETTARQLRERHASSCTGSPAAGG